jgi:ribonucleoside-diphosphate reductase beta chain
LILFTLFVERVSLFSQFYIINWFGRFKNVLKDTDQQVRYTRNEELIHALVGIKLINTIREEMPELFDEELEERIAHEMEQSFISESKIIDWAVNGMEEENLSAPILKELVKSTLNDCAEQIGFKKVFTIDQELIEKTMWFEEELMGSNMTDFFHAKSVEYSKNSQCYEEDELF